MAHAACAMAMGHGAHARGRSVIGISHGISHHRGRDDGTVSLHTGQVPNSGHRDTGMPEHASNGNHRAVAAWPHGH
eukprot:SAG31_NODE_600_length_13647_cov_3.894376_9_plen_76_part_00